jgi:hypothetical protein
MIGDQAVDFTQVDNNRLKSAFELKKQKYGFIYNNKQYSQLLSPTTYNSIQVLLTY